MPTAKRKTTVRRSTRRTTVRKQKTNSRFRFLKSNKKLLAITSILVVAVLGASWLLMTRAETNTANFTHPGILVSQSQLDFVKAKIDSEQEPWLTSFNRMKSSSLASKTYTPSPVPKLMCSTSVGLNEGFPQAGCTEMNRDSSAAYVQSLMYYFTGDVTYANNTAKIQNAWSTTLKEIPYDQPRTKNGEPAYWQNLLVVGWSTQNMTRGAEIIRYTSSSLTPADVSRAEGWYKNLIYPFLNAHTAGGIANGGMTWTESLINIGIFTNDPTIYNRGLDWYRKKSPQLIYLTKDGAKPPMPTDANTGKAIWGNVDLHWKYPTRYINGMTTETCRDMGHAFMGLGAYANIAETVLIQGTDDLYTENQDRFLASFELNSDYVNQMLDRMAAAGQTAKQVTDSTWVPSNFPCTDFKDGGASAFLGTEIAYNHFANRKGNSMPNTKKLVERVRPQSGGNHLLFEALTHANTGNAGIPVPAPDPTPDPEPEPVTPASLQLSGLTSGATVQSTLNVEAKVLNATNIQRVRFFIDNAEVASEGTAPYCMGGDSGGVCNNFSLANIADGDHTLKVSALYGTSQTVEASLQFKKTSPTPPPPPPPAEDTQAPSTPVGLTRSLTANWGKLRYDLRLTWQPSADNVGVQEYTITRNGQPLGTSPNPSYTDSSLKAGTLYTYNVFAKDAKGNTSGPAITTAKANCFLFVCGLQ